MNMQELDKYYQRRSENLIRNKGSEAAITSHDTILYALKLVPQHAIAYLEKYITLNERWLADPRKESMVLMLKRRVWLYNVVIKQIKKTPEYESVTE